MDRNQLHTLDKEKSIVDLGAHYDSNLTLGIIFQKKISKAYSVLGIIKRNFIHMTTYYT